MTDVFNMCVYSPYSGTQNKINKERHDRQAHLNTDIVQYN